MSYRPDLPIGTTITLTDEEVAHYSALGRLRTRANEENETGLPGWGPHRDPERDAWACCSEYAFCKLFGLPLDQVEDVGCRSDAKGTDDRKDTYTPDGETIDVKVTDGSHHQLAIQKLPRVRADYYVLMIGPRTGKHFVYRGAIRGEDAFRRRDRSVGKNRPYCTYQHELKTLEDLKRERNDQAARTDQRCEDRDPHPGEPGPVGLGLAGAEQPEHPADDVHPAGGTAPRSRGRSAHSAR